MGIQWNVSNFTYPQIVIYKRPCFPIAALSLSCVLVVILFILPNSNFLGVVDFLVVIVVVFVVVAVVVVVVFVVVVVTCVVVFIVEFVLGSEGSVEDLIVTVEVVEVCVVGLVKGVFRYGQNTCQNYIL